MKNRYCAVLISCASVLAANAATIIAELPESANLSQTATMAPQTGNQLLDKVKGREFGVYAGGNNNSLANWPQNGEGTWVNHDDVGSIILCGRSGVAGDSFAMVLGGPRAFSREMAALDPFRRERLLRAFQQPHPQCRLWSGEGHLLENCLLCRGAAGCG